MAITGPTHHTGLYFEKTTLVAVRMCLFAKRYKL